MGVISFAKGALCWRGDTTSNSELRAVIEGEVIAQASRYTNLPAARD